MKKILLGLFSFSAILSASAQIEMYEDGTGPDVSGTSVVKNVTSSDVFPLEVHFHVVNNTGSDGQWRITRVEKSVPVAWDDQICWPPQCYLTGGQVTYVTPNSGGNPAPIVMDGTDSTTNNELAEMKPRITPDQSVNGIGTYMYYVTDLSGNYLDSVELVVNFSLGIEELSNLQVKVSPNPVSENLNVQVTGDLTGVLKLVDILGNVVYTGKGGTINVSNFTDGVYFLIAEDKKGNLLNQKVIVRH